MPIRYKAPPVVNSHNWLVCNARWPVGGTPISNATVTVTLVDPNGTTQLAAVAVPADTGASPTPGLYRTLVPPACWPVGGTYSASWSLSVPGPDPYGNPGPFVLTLQQTILVPR